MSQLKTVMFSLYNIIERVIIIINYMTNTIFISNEDVVFFYLTNLVIICTQYCNSIKIQYHKKMQRFICLAQ